MIKLELTDEEAGLIRGAIDFVIKQGGTPAARQLLSLDDKVLEADKLCEIKKGIE